MGWSSRVCALVGAGMFAAALGWWTGCSSGPGTGADASTQNGADGGVAPDADLAAGPDASEPGLDAAALPADAYAPPPTPKAWTLTRPMFDARANQTMSLMPGGKVLVAGGEIMGTPRVALTTTEYFSPGSGTFAHGPALPEPRANHTATVLKDHRILLVGGGVSSAEGPPAGGASVLNSALLFDPVLGTITATHAMRTARSHHAAVRLNDGRVLVVGGGTRGVDATNQLGISTALAEIWDPATGNWTDAAPMQNARFLPQAKLLASGKVLVMGGGTEAWTSVAPSEIYDPVANTWSTAAASTGGGRVFFASALLDSGKVFVSCGMGWTPAVWKSDAELYDPVLNQWATGGDPGFRRSGPVFAELGNKVLVGGGQYHSLTSYPYNADTMIYDETTGLWTDGPALNVARSLGAAVVLLSGDILICGGFSAAGDEISCEVSSH